MLLKLCVVSVIGNCHTKIARVKDTSSRLSIGLGDILIYRHIFNCNYPVEGKNLSDDLSKLSSCSMSIVTLLRNQYIACKILKK